MIKDILKLDVLLHVIFGAALGAWYMPIPFVGKVAVGTVIYLFGELREHLELIGNFQIKLFDASETDKPPNATRGESFGRAHRIEALGWLVGAIIGAIIRKLITGR